MFSANASNSAFELSFCCIANHRALDFALRAMAPSPCDFRLPPAIGCPVQKSLLSSWTSLQCRTRLSFPIYRGGYTSTPSYIAKWTRPQGKTMTLRAMNLPVANVLSCKTRSFGTPTPQWSCYEYRWNWKALSLCEDVTERVRESMRRLKRQRARAPEESGGQESQSNFVGAVSPPRHNTRGNQYAHAMKEQVGSVNMWKCIHWMHDVACCTILHGCDCSDIRNMSK